MTTGPSSTQAPSDRQGPTWWRPRRIHQWVGLAVAAGWCLLAIPGAFLSVYSGRRVQAVVVSVVLGVPGGAVVGMLAGLGVWLLGKLVRSRSGWSWVGLAAVFVAGPALAPWLPEGPTHSVDLGVSLAAFTVFVGTVTLTLKLVSRRVPDTGATQPVSAAVRGVRRPRARDRREPGSVRFVAVRTLVPYGVVAVALSALILAFPRSFGPMVFPEPPGIGLALYIGAFLALFVLPFSFLIALRASLRRSRPDVAPGGVVTADWIYDHEPANAPGPPGWWQSEDGGWHPPGEAR